MTDISKDATRSTVELVGGRVRLREFCADDVDDALTVVGDQRVTRLLSFDSRDREQTRAVVSGAMARAAEQPRTEYYLAIALPNCDQLIGFIRLALTGVKAAKLGYAVACAHQGNGYATDAVRVMLSFAFGKLDLHRVTAAIGPDNASSLALVHRLGFSAEGRLREHVYTNGVWRDSLLYSILAQEWCAASAAE